MGSAAVPVSEEPVEDLGFIESANIIQAAPIDPMAAFSTEPLVESVIEAPPVQSVFTMPKIEPEIMKQWREDFKIRCDKIEEQAVEEVRNFSFCFAICRKPSNFCGKSD